jgi:hypothetical protein
VGGKGQLEFASRLASMRLLGGRATYHGGVVTKLRPVESGNERVESESGDLSEDGGNPDGVGCNPGDPVEVREGLEETTGLKGHEKME